MSERSLTYHASVAKRSERAEPLPPDDRRRAIIDAVIPLLLSHGPTVTTREMADAAGIAEGTIFRVFPDKHSVVHEAIKASMDPAPIEQRLATIPETDSLEAQLEEAARVLLERSERVAALVGMLRTVGSPTAGPPSGARKFVIESNAAILAALTALFERHGDDLRVDPSRAAVAFQGFVFAGGHPLIAPKEKPTPGEIVSILLFGITAPPEERSS